SCVFSFFFQAEDGIRDRNVTGVQTCALPIYRRIEICVRQDEEGGISAELHGAAEHLIGGPTDEVATHLGGSGEAEFAHTGVRERSEERRVGKEGRRGRGERGGRKNRRGVWRE